MTCALVYLTACWFPSPAFPLIHTVLEKTRISISETAGLQIRGQSKTFRRPTGLIKDHGLLYFSAITWKDLIRYLNSEITSPTFMGNFLGDRKILYAAITSIEVTAVWNMGASEHTYTHTDIDLSWLCCRYRHVCRITMSIKGLVYTSAPQLSHPPLACVRWCLSLSGLMRRSVMHVVQCLAPHIHLRHSASAMCVLHYHPKHQYLDILHGKHNSYALRQTVTQMHSYLQLLTQN